MVSILAIGNSFSRDATTYLHAIAQAGGIDCQVENLYIGGCSLEQHMFNVSQDLAAYTVDENGETTERTASIREALCRRAWTHVTVQQASHDSGLPETYEPYLRQLCAVVRRYAPGCTLWLHETWAYETDSTHSEFHRYGCDQAQMYRRLREVYRAQAAALSLPLIPCGDVIQALRRQPAFDYAHGGQSLCRDGFHMHLTYGRYAAAATWYETLLRGDIRENPFVPAGGGRADPALLRTIRETVHAVCAQEARE